MDGWMIITHPPVGSNTKVQTVLILSHRQLKRKANSWRHRRDQVSTVGGHGCHLWQNATISLASWQLAELSEEHLELQYSYVQQSFCPHFSVDFVAKKTTEAKTVGKTFRIQMVLRIMLHKHSHFKKGHLVSESMCQSPLKLGVYLWFGYTRAWAVVFSLVYLPCRAILSIQKCFFFFL